MADIGTTGDAVAGDGRYTVQVTLPQQVSTIGGISFAAQAQNGERAELKSSAGFTHINIFSLITKYYNDILDRAPEPGGAEWWTAEIERIVSLGIDVKEGFLAASKLFFNSDEYRAKRTDDTRFVSDLYQVFLNRLPDQGGLNFWLDQLRQGLTRDMLITQFAYCDEFNSYIEGILGSGVRRPENDLVNDLYRGFLGRFPDSAGFNHWLSQMRNAQCSGSQAVKNLTYQVALAFVKSTEYGMRNRDDMGYVEDLYNAILRRGADPAGFTTWVNKLKTTTREAVLTSFTNSPEFQTRVNEVIGAGCVQ
jgi:hypothetical protein